MTDAETTYDAPHQAIAEEIRSERARKGIPLGTVVELAEVPKTTYIRYEKGRRDIPTDTLDRICAVLGVTPGDITRQAMARHPEAFRSKVVRRVRKA